MRCLRLKRRLAGQALENDCANGPKIRLGAVLFGHDHLGCLQSWVYIYSHSNISHHVHRRSTKSSGHDAVLKEARKAEVGDFQRDLRRHHIALGRLAHEDILRLEISVHNALLIHCAQRVSYKVPQVNVRLRALLTDLSHEAANSVFGQCSFRLQIIRQVATVAVFHDEEYMRLCLLQSFCL